MVRFHLICHTSFLTVCIDSRERNRIHARNSRERKKNQLDVLQRRMQQLLDEVCY